MFDNATKTDHLFKYSTLASIYSMTTTWKRRKTFQSILQHVTYYTHNITLNLLNFANAHLQILFLESSITSFGDIKIGEPFALGFDAILVAKDNHFLLQQDKDSC